MNGFAETLQNAIDNLAHLKFDKNYTYHQYLIGIYCRICELSDSIIFLAANGKEVGIPVLTRALQEAYVDLKNLCEDESYRFNMEALYLSGWLRVTKEAGTLKNNYLQGLADHDDFEEQVQSWDERLEELNNKGFKPLHYIEKFQKADMESEYRSVYNFLCAVSHNDIRVLLERHFNLNDETGEMEGIHIFKEPEPPEENIDLAMCAQYLKSASMLIHEALDTGKQDIFKL